MYHGFVFTYSTHSERKTDINASINESIICSHGGSSTNGPQAIIWTKAGMLLIEHLWTNFNVIVIEIQFSFNKVPFKCRKRMAFCPGLIVKEDFGLIVKEDFDLKSRSRQTQSVVSFSLLSPLVNLWNFAIHGTTTSKGKYVLCPHSTLEKK